MTGIVTQAQETPQFSLHITDFHIFTLLNWVKIVRLIIFFALQKNLAVSLWSTQAFKDQDHLAHKCIWLYSAEVTNSIVL